MVSAVVFRYRKPGFTIVELMTVIAVLALLLAILLPSLGRAREQMYESQCRSNLHQITNFLSIPRGAKGTEFPRPTEWLGAVSGAGGAKVLRCPLDPEPPGNVADLKDVYILHDHPGSGGKREIHYHYLQDILDGGGDRFQIHVARGPGVPTYFVPVVSWLEQNQAAIAVSDTTCMIVITFGPSITIASVGGTGSLGSYHYLCKGPGGANYESQILMKLRSIDNTQNPPLGSIAISGAAVSYAMNGQVRSRPRNDQLVMLEYKRKTVADQDGAGNNDEVFDDYFQPRHFNRSNVSFGDGSIHSLTRTEIDPSEPIWRP